MLEIPLLSPNVKIAEPVKEKEWSQCSMAQQLHKSVLYQDFKGGFFTTSMHVLYTMVQYKETKVQRKSG